MAGSVKVRDASALLSEVYRNVRMAEDSIINLMPKVTEERLKNELTVQISVYSAFSSRAAKQLAQAGVVCGLDAGEIGRHGRLLLGEAAAQSA